MQNCTAQNPHITLLLRLADDHMIAGHRLSQWCGHAPTLEEDLALPNMALDLLGQARTLYAYVGEVEGQKRSEDDFAFLRNEREYSNLLLLEIPNGDFARTMLRHLYFSLYMHHYWQGLQYSHNTHLASIAQKAVKESLYHVRHTSQWVIRLGDGTEESAQRLNAAHLLLAPYLGEMFTDDQFDDELEQAYNGLAPKPSSIVALWLADFAKIATLAYLPKPDLSLRQRGGRQGLHSEDLGFLLAEMQSLHRAHPNVTW